MKLKLASVVLLAIAGQAAATVTINTIIGQAFGTDGTTPVAEGTLWALVVDDGDNNFAGFGLDSSLFAANQSVPGVADTFFTAGQSISLGSSLAGGTIFAMGGTNGLSTLGVAGATSDALAGLSLGVNGLAAGAEYAFFFFPGASFTGGPSETIGSAVGGLSSTTAEGDFGLAGMVIPPDGATVSQGAVSVTLGGATANSSFTAVQLVPEPSAALLGALGALGLLRRRRA